MESLSAPALLVITNIRNNFYQTIFSQMFGSVQAGPLFFATPHYNGQIKSPQNYANMGVQTCAKVW